MYTLNCSEAEIQELNYERYYYPSAIVQKRFHVIYLRATTKLSNKKIGLLLDRHPNTITKDIKCYLREGIKGLKTVKYGTNTSELFKHKTSIEAIFEASPPMTIKEARHRIKELTGIDRSLSQIRNFMKRIGLKRYKTGHIPAKADRAKQELWLETKLNPILEKAKVGEVHLLFMDAAHFVLAPFLCFLWSFKRLFIKAPAGRKRLNVLGAVNAITKNIYFSSNSTTINAAVIADFLHQLRIYYYDMKPIYIVLDNARYQHCQFIRYVAWQFNIHLLFLPPYSPNLNIIERLWKFVKKKALYAKYYPSFEEFKNAILLTLNKANKHLPYQLELKSLLNLKFQLF